MNTEPDKSNKMVIVSACLMGVNCRYDGKNNLSSKFTLPAEETAVLICPEQLGGLPTPREASEISGGDGRDVHTGKAAVSGIHSGTDFSENYLRGAYETLRITRLFRCRKAYLKRNSPSCGCGDIYQKGILVKGNGVTTALLLMNNIEIQPI